MTRRRGWLLVVTLTVVALAARLLPLHLSPLPFNTDAYVFVSEAEQIRHANAVAFTGPTAPYPDEYLFDVLLAAASDVTGVAPLYLIQSYVAALGVVPVLVAAALATRVTRSRPRTVALLTGLGVALEGLYLWRTMTVSSETMGIAVLAVLLLTTHRAFLTRRPAWFAIAIPLAALLPIVHNGTTFVGGLVVSVMIVLYAARRPTLRRTGVSALAIGGFWTVAFGYYELVDLPQSSRVSAAPALFIAWLALAVIAARWLTTATERVQYAVPLAIVGVGFLAFAYNALNPIFPGSASTSPLLLALVVPLLVIAAIAARGFPAAATRSGLPLLALFFGPIAAVGFAMTAGRTIEYQALATRSQTFAHLAVVPLAAVAVAAVVHSDRRLTIRAAVAVVFVVAVLATVPFPFVVDEATPFKATTTPEEFETAMFAVEYVPERWAGDDHVTLIANRYRSIGATDLPVFTWLEGGPPPGCPTVGQRSWTTSGAPAYPEKLYISADAYERWQTQNDVIYATTGSDPLIIVDSTSDRSCKPLPGLERER